MSVPFMTPKAHKLFLLIRERPGLSRLELLFAMYGDNSRGINVISTHVSGINDIIAKVGLVITFREGGYFLENKNGLPSAVSPASSKA
ncbi:MAG: hypothetical protein NTX56_04000 [Proteobacteria bacterium]|nr:hypothetical protein [Pseudomonadota bacterium]